MLFQMRFLWIIVVLSVVTVLAEGKRKRKFEGDFEFADEVEPKSNQKNVEEHKKWIHDPNSELCKPLNCKKKEMCLLDETYAAFCVNKKEIHKNGDVIVPKSKVTEPPAKDDEAVDEDEDEDDDDEDDEDDDDIFYDSEDGHDDDEAPDNSLRCKTCPIVKPVFLCGSDNRTYSSLCRLDYHNCLHRSHVKISCKGFCPCKAEVELMLKKKQKQAERMNNLMAKFRSTMEREKLNSNSNNNKYKSEKTVKPSKLDNLEKSYKAFKYDKYNSMKSAEKKKYQDKYSYVPEEFKYDNKHYKYIKYKKYSKDFYGSEDKSHNEVIETKGNRLLSKDCPASALQLMGNRLLDWFSVVMSEAKKRKQPKMKADLPGWCKSEVRWMFGYLDLDGDEKLSLQELYHMEHDHSEKCVKPFVDSCDSDRDIFISPKEWCHCFDKTDRPCAAAKRRLSPESLMGSFVPDCDGQGYFRTTQCHASSGMCWCVDKHGVEFSNTRTRGKPNCEKLIEKSQDPGKKDAANSEKVNIDDEDEEDEGNESDLEGSADQPLDF